jgi:hypothetical protein
LSYPGRTLVAVRAICLLTTNYDRLGLLAQRSARASLRFEALSLLTNLLIFKADFQISKQPDIIAT